MKKEVTSSRATSANISITGIDIRSNLGSAISINVKSINEQENTNKLDKQNQRPVIESAENSNKLENLSVSVISSNETLIRSSAQTKFLNKNKIVRHQSDHHNKIEKEKISKEWIVPGFGFIAVMVLLLGIIFGFIGAFGGIFLKEI